MANKLLRISTLSRTTYIDINSSSIYIRSGTWRTIPEPDEGVITETFELVFTGNDAAIRTAVETLSVMAQRVVDWNIDPLVETSVWWEENSQGEASTTKRALILELSFAPSQDGPYTQLLGKNAAFYTVVITHRDVYEEAAAPSSVGNTGISCMGGKINKGSVVGSAHGRVVGLEVLSEDAGYTLSKMWLGFRDLYGKAAADVFSNFSPWQEAEAGTAVTGSIHRLLLGDISPSTAVNNCWRVTSVPATINAAADWYLDIDATSRPYARGNYLALGRIRVDAGVVGIEYSYGPDSQGAAPRNIFRNEIQYASNTDFAFVELGTYKFPFYGRMEQSIATTLNPVDFGRMSMRIFQISGTTTEFILDGVVLVPSDRLIKADNCTAGDTSTDEVYFAQNEEDRMIALNLHTSGGATYPASSPDATFMNWNWPWDGGLMVIAAQRSTGVHVIADTCTVKAAQIARYRAFLA